MKNFCVSILYSLCLTGLVLSVSGKEQHTSLHSAHTLPPTERQPIKLGAILPLTGTAAELAIQHKRGLELAVEQINKPGGIDGRQVDLIAEDDQNDPKTTVTAFQKLVE